jgi:hypothetical protein
MTQASAGVTLHAGLDVLDEGSFDSARETFGRRQCSSREVGRRWETTHAEIAIGYAVVGS